jgi:hypothetical protein
VVSLPGPGASEHRKGKPRPSLSTRSMWRELVVGPARLEASEAAQVSQNGQRLRRRSCSAVAQPICSSAAAIESR